MSLFIKLLMRVLVKSVFFKLGEPMNKDYNEFINLFFWIFLMGFNVIKWLYPFIMLESTLKYTFLGIISFSALFKICSIGIPIIIKIKHYFGKCIIALFALISNLYH